MHNMSGTDDPRGKWDHTAQAKRERGKAQDAQGRERTDRQGRETDNHCHGNHPEDASLSSWSHKLG